MAKEKTSHIVQSLLVNVAIAAAKWFAAVMTGSGALLAEAIHSTADCTNQVLLLIGVRGSAKPPTREHPLGHGREAYFWSFLVALLLFSLGGMFSIYEGHPQAAASRAGRALSARPRDPDFLDLSSRAARPSPTSARSTADGRSCRSSATSRRPKTRTSSSSSARTRPRWSGSRSPSPRSWPPISPMTAAGMPRAAWGSASVLIVVAVFLAIEVKSLLLGRARGRGDRARGSRHRPRGRPDHRDLVAHHLAARARRSGPRRQGAHRRILAGDAVARAINEFEQAVHDRCPEVRWLFVEPDIEA